MRNFFLLLLTIFMCITATAQSFKISAEKDVDLKQYKTFAVTKGEIISSVSRKIDNEAFYTEFKKFVIRELESKGYTQSSEPSDFTISYVVEISEQLESQNLGPLGGEPVDNPALVDQPQHWSREFTEGALIIDVEDSQRKRSVWTASGTMDITKARGAKLLDRCVKRALKKFPKNNKKG